MKDEIVVIRFGRMGDFLVSLPAILHLRESNPESKITLITGVVRKAVYKTRVASYSDSIQFPWVDIFNKKLFDAVVYINGLGSIHSLSNLISVIAGRRVKAVYYFCYYNEDPFRLLLKRIFLNVFSFGKLQQKTQTVPSGVGKKSSLQAWQCLENVGYNGDINKLISALALTLKSGSVNKNSGDCIARIQCQNRKIICVYPSSTFEHKRWPAENFSEVVRWLVDCGYYVVLIGHHGEYDINQKVLELSRSENILNLAGKTTFCELVELMQGVLMLIGNDGGLMHLAAMMNVPSITIMSGVFHDRIWDPFGNHSVVVRYEVECSNCLNEFYCPNNTSQCVSSISVDVVKDNFKKLILTFKNEQN